MKVIFHLVPQSRSLQAVFNEIAQIPVVAINPQSVRDVFEDRFGKGIGTLENHSHATTQPDHIHLANVLAVEENFSRVAAVTNRVIHAIQGPQESGFAAAGWPDERG